MFRVGQMSINFEPLKLATNSFDETMKLKFMAQSLNQDLTTLTKLEKWLIDSSTITKHVKKLLASSL